MSSIVQAIPISQFADTNHSDLSVMFNPLIELAINNNHGQKIPFTSFVEMTRLEYYPNEDFRFATKFADWVDQCTKLIVCEYELVGFGVFDKEFKTNHLQKIITRLKLIEDKHYRIETLDKDTNWQLKIEYGIEPPGTKANIRSRDRDVHFFSPDAIKTILQNTTKTDIYRSYFQMLEKVSVFYMRYELMLERAEKEAAQSKVLALESENQDLQSQIKHLINEVSDFKSTTSKQFTNIIAQNETLINNTVELKAQNETLINETVELKSQNKTLIVKVDSLQSDVCFMKRIITQHTKATMPTLNVMFRPMIMHNKMLSLNYDTWNKDPAEAKREMFDKLNNKSAFKQMNTNVKFMFVIPLCMTEADNENHFTMKYVFRVRNFLTLSKCFDEVYDKHIRGQDHRCDKKRYLMFKPIVISSYEFEVNKERALFNRIDLLLHSTEYPTSLNLTKKLISCGTIFKSRNAAFEHYNYVVNMLLEAEWINNPAELYEGQAIIDDESAYNTIVGINRSYDKELRESFQSVLDQYIKPRNPNDIHKYKPNKHVFEAFEYNNATLSNNRNIKTAVRDTNYFIMSYIHTYAERVPNTVTKLITNEDDTSRLVLLQEDPNHVPSSIEEINSSDDD